MDRYEQISKDTRPDAVKIAEFMVAGDSPEAATKALTDYVINSARTTEGYHERATIDAHSKRVVTGMEDVRKIDTLIPKLVEMQQLLNIPELNTGTFVSLVSPVKGVLADWGFPIDDQLGEQQTLDAISASLIQFMRAPGVGAMSDFDAKKIEASVANLAGSEEKNAAVVQMLLHQNRARKVALNTYEDMFMTSGGDMTTMTTDKVDEAISKALTDAKLHKGPFVELPPMLTRTGTRAEQSAYFLRQEELGYIKEGDLIRMPSGMFKLYDSTTRNAFEALKDGDN
jgi:hypothetical protein